MPFLNSARPLLRLHHVKMFALLAIFCVLTLGCVESKHPFSDPDASVADLSAVGVWKEVVESNKVSLLIIGLNPYRSAKGAPPGLMSFQRVELGEENELSSGSEGTFFPSKIGNDNFMNCYRKNTEDLRSLQSEGDKYVMVWKPNMDDYFTILKYRLDGDQLELWDGNEEGVAAAIESGGVKGIVERDAKDNHLTVAKLTDTTANIRKYIATNGSKVLFRENTKKRIVASNYHNEPVWN